MLHIETFKKCFPNYISVRSGGLYYNRFYETNDINYKDDELYLDLERGGYIVFSTEITDLRILKAKELLDVLNLPF